MNNALNKIFWNWDIHYACNYRCSYCFLAEKWDVASKENKYPGINEWIEVWDRLYEKYGSCHIHFSGGEPFTYPDFFILIISLSKKHTLEFSTNLSFDVNYFVKKMDPKRAKLNVSFHPEFSDSEEFFEKASRLKINSFPIAVSFVAYPPHLKDMKGISARCREIGVTLIVQLFRGQYREKSYPEGYTESEAELIKLYGASFSANRTQLVRHLNQKTEIKKICQMGQAYGKIYASADVYRCCSTGASKIGNILDDADFRLLDGPEPCEIKDCICWKRMVVGEEDKWKTQWS
jgi:hypothetical protein